MKSIFHTQAEFLSAGEVTFPTKKVPVANALITEEYLELVTEPHFTVVGNQNDLKECLDLIYVCAQYMNESVGPDKAQALMNALHEDNMSKCTDGKLVKDPKTGKILKPVGYSKAQFNEKFSKILGNK